MSNPLRRGPKPPDPTGTAKPKSQAASTPTPPVEPPNRTAEILTISVIVALLVLFGIGLMLWAVEYQEYRGCLGSYGDPYGYVCAGAHQDSGFPRDSFF